MLTNTHIVPQAASAKMEYPKALSFAFGRNAYILFALGLLFLGPAFFKPTFLWGVLVWDAAVLLAWLVDLQVLPKPWQLMIRREWEGALILDGSTRVNVSVEAAARTRLQCEMVVDLPEGLAFAPERREFTLTPPKPAEVEIEVLPRKRGDMALGSIYLRYRSPLQIAERWASVPLPQQVRVYPGTGDRREQSLSLLRTRRIEILKRLSRRRGAGREFESLREYRDGDAKRDICWPATARRGRLIVKEYQVERSQPVWIVVDCGRLMRASTGDRTRLDHAVAAALNVAEVAMFGGDRVGLITYGHQVSGGIGLGRGQQHMRAIMDQLATVQAEPGEANHSGAAARLLLAQSRRSLIIWITDLPDTAITPEVFEGAAALLGRHLLIFAVMSDPEVNSIASRHCETADEVFESAAAMDVLHRRERLMATLRGRGAHTIEVSSEQLPREIVREYVSIKEKELL